MSLKISRVGYLGLGIETIPGTAVPATAAIPFITNTLQGKRELISDIAARGSRAQDFTSVLGKGYADGELEVNVDTLNSGFLLKLATGNEAVSAVAANVHDHLFYTTTSGNTPLTATLYQTQAVDTQLFSSVCVDKLDVNVKDGMMTMKAALKGKFPTSGAFTNTSVSGTLLTFGSYTLKQGATLALAAVASGTPVTDFDFSINNNAELIYESGTSNVSRLAWRQLQITGSFTRFFESANDRDDYLNMVKYATIVTASGMALGGGYNESISFNFAKIAYTDASIETGIDNFFAVKTTFTAEVDPLQGKQFDCVLRNYKSTVYA